MLLDEDDPTFNNPALDLEDSDVDDEWTPIKEKVSLFHNAKKYNSKAFKDIYHIFLL